MADTFPIPSFGPATNAGFSPNAYQTSPQTYQPMPKVEQPSFGPPYGRPQTPSQHNRRTSYNKGGESDIPSLQPSVERVRRHREYYLDGGDIIFLVENYLFRVHRYFFERESPVFRKQLADAAHGGHHRIGMSDTDPCVLHDVRTEDFSRFLWVFYNPLYSIYEATTEDWAAILGLAHHWQFSEIKALVVRELEKQVIPSITKIVIYHRYGVDRNLLLPSYIDLCQREHTLDYEEAKDLGLETSLMIMTAREIVRKGDGSLSATVALSHSELQHVIRQIFRFPGPRSDSPMSSTSDSTVAEPSPPADGSPNLNQPLEKPSDLPPIRTEALSSSNAHPAVTDTPPAEVPVPSSEAKTGQTVEEAPKQQPPRLKTPPPVASKEPATPTRKETIEPPTPIQGSQLDQTRPATPTTGQSVVTGRTRKTGAKVRKEEVKKVLGAVQTTSTTEQETTHPKAQASTDKNDGTEVDVAGDVPWARVDAGDSRVGGREGVDVKESRPGDDIIMDTQQQAPKSFSGVDALQSTADDVYMGGLDDHDSGKKMDVPTLTPVFSDAADINDEPTTTMTVGEDPTKVEATIVVSNPVVTDAPTSAAVANIPLSQDHDVTPTTETTTRKNVMRNGDGDPGQTISASVVVAPGQSEEESLVTLEQRLVEEVETKDTETKLKPLTPSTGENLFNFRGALAWLASTQTDTEEGTNQGVIRAKRSLSRDFPLSDDEELFMDCDSIAGSVSNFGGS